MLLRGLDVLLVGSNTWEVYCRYGWFFGCVSRFHTMRDWMVLKAIWKETNQANHDGLDPNASKWNCFYALRARK